jgi:hypothetical protein
MKNTLALVLMVFGIVGCGQNTMELVCKVGDSDYEFQLNIANKTASRTSTNPEFTTIEYMEFDLEVTPDFYILEPTKDSYARPYKIHRNNLHLITSQDMAFKCEDLGAMK